MDRAGYLGPHVTAITVSETAVPRGLLTHRPFESLPLATRSPPPAGPQLPRVEIGRDRRDAAG